MASRSRNCIEKFQFGKNQGRLCGITDGVPMHRGRGCGGGGRTVLGCFLHAFVVDAFGSPLVEQFFFLLLEFGAGSVSKTERWCGSGVVGVPSAVAGGDLSHQCCGSRGRTGRQGRGRHHDDDHWWGR